ncbi:MAG TPA: SDR family NAD(P)-dependent oxidoreductase [Longimicrobiales bacterium]
MAAGKGLPGSRGRRWLVVLGGGVAGAALGVGLVAGGALLLYEGPRILAAVGVLLALALVALGAGLWAGGSAGESTRAQWVSAVVSFAAAGGFSHLWMERPGVQEAAFGRALGVLLFVVAPAYVVGALLAALDGRSRALAGGARDGSPVGLAALWGAAAGALAAGVVLIPHLEPARLFLGSAVLLAVLSAWEGRPGVPGLRRQDGAMQGKVAVITGVGSRGQVGYAVAEAFLAEGARLVVADLSPEVEALARELGRGGEVVGVTADLTRPEEAERTVAAARERFGRLDVLVNVAGGLSVVKPLAETTPEEWSRELDRNATTAFVMSCAAIPLLRERGGAIINFASPAGLRARAGLGAYSAAKASVVALTRALALEERPYGIRVNAIAPGMIDTEQNRQTVEDPTSVKWVTREEIARVVLFLASDTASGISGETIHVLGEGLE